MAKVFLAEERDRIGWSLAARVREGSIPPDDAYQWVRILCEMTRKLQEQDPESMFTNTPIIKFLTVLVLALIPALASAQAGACPTSTALAVNPNGWVCITPGTDYNFTTDPGTGPVPVVV